LVRFGPEESGLRAARRTAEDSFRTTVRQADATSQGIQAAIKSTRPQVRKDFDAAGLQAARAAHVAEPDLAGANVPASLRAVVAAERSGFTSRLGEARAGALTELSNRRVQAVEGAGFAKQNAQRELASTLTQLFQRGQDLAKERGAFTASTATELHTAAQERAQQLAIAEGRNTTQTAIANQRNATTRRGQNLSHADRQAAARARGRGGGQTRGGATREELGAAQDVIGQALNEAHGFKADGTSRGDAAALLLNGSKEQRIALHDPATGKPLYDKDGKPRVKVIPGVPKIGHQLLLSVALDVAYDGHVSRANHRALLHRGLSVRDLGLPTYGQWRRRSRRASAPSPLAPGANGQSRPT
jgi:hypothetical protein